MKVIKTDGRYNYHNQGFHVILEFNMKIRTQREQFYQVQRTAQRVYGDLRTLELENNRWKMNENWRASVKSDHKHRRIHLREEHDVTMLMLQVEA